LNNISKLKEKYDKAKKEREILVCSIINSSSKRKIIVGGPGTGKTYLFKRVLNGKNKSLTLTFVRSLVEDLSLELCGLSDVKTLHSFAYSILNKTNANIKIFPKLPEVIKEDAKILHNEEIDFNILFHNRNDEHEYIKFYKKRKDYYGEYYGYSDIIFAVVKYLEMDKSKIPSYDQIVVDEFQDFNKLEVSLIDLLSERSPILLAGDDDQALYDFKDANSEYIRERYNSKNQGFAPFSLPHCSRCTRVIVEAANDIIRIASKKGFLSNRITKEYCYFEDEIKDVESNQYPKIIYSKIFDRRIPWFIEQQIGAIAKDIKERFSILIISPTGRKSRDIGNTLKQKGFQNIEFVKKISSIEPNLMDGLRILLKENKSNLGWRIACKYIMDENDFDILINETNQDGAKNIYELINNDYKNEINKLLKLLRAVRDKKFVDEDELHNLLNKINYKSYEKANEFLYNEIISTSPPLSIPGLKKIPIKSTTIQSAKGLAAEYVFITHFDDQYFIKDKNKISDQDICNFLVSLTRAKRKVFLISSKTNDEPTFLKWINGNWIEKLQL
jgi:superfamily I DNA/RNA helicase